MKDYILHIQDNHLGAKIFQGAPLKVLKDLIHQHVELRFDHKNLNLDTEEFKTLNPTAENICFVIWNILRGVLEDKYELTVRLYETPRNYVEYPA